MVAVIGDTDDAGSRAVHQALGLREVGVLHEPKSWMSQGTGMSVLRLAVFSGLANSLLRKFVFYLLSRFNRFG